MSVMEPDASTSMLFDEDQYFTLQHVVREFNRENHEFKIQKRDLLRCAELNFISLKFNCPEDLRLVVFDDRNNVENTIGNYTYGNMVEILDYTLSPDQSDEYFTTHKVRPLKNNLLKPKGITSPEVQSKFLSSPYYFVPNFFVSEEFDPDYIPPPYEDSIVEISQLMLAKSDLTKIKFAVESLKRQVNENPISYERNTIVENSLENSDSNSQPAIVSSMHKINGNVAIREHRLAAEIKEAKKRASDPSSVHCVWNELVKMAHIKEMSLLENCSADEIKYGSPEDPQFFLKSSLKTRMYRERNKIAKLL
jgi:hypothetical protein